MKKTFEQKKLLSLIIFTALSLIPLLVISFFNRPSADDFNYSWRTYRTLQNGGGLFAILKSALDNTVYYWHNWQGLYTSAFLLALQPAIFGNHFYVLTGWLMILLIGGSTLYATYYIGTKLLGISTLESLTVGSLECFLMLQFMPSCVEGLFWFNGTVNYGFFYVIMLFILCCSISIIRKERISVPMTILLFLLCFLVEGGNHVTAFMSILLLILLIAYCAFKATKKMVLFFSSALGFSVLCFLFNVLSPGTKVRQASHTGVGIIPAIYLSFRYGMTAISNWFNLASFMVILICLPLLWHTAYTCYKKTGFRFAYPLLVLIGSVCWECATFSLPLYAMGAPGAGRHYDVVFYFFVVLLFANILYTAGWLIRTTEEKGIHLPERIDYSKRTFIILFVLLAVISLDSWAMEACSELANGSAITYSREADARESMCLHSEGTNLTIEPYSVRPTLLFFSDITEDAEDWTNTAFARYYSLESVKIVYNQ